MLDAESDGIGLDADAQLCLSVKEGEEWIPIRSKNWQHNPYGGFIKDEYCSWVQYKSGPGGGPSM